MMEQTANKMHVSSVTGMWPGTFKESLQGNEMHPLSKNCETALVSLLV